MTLSFFNIGHACPVQRSYKLLLRVEILLSHTLFLYLPPAHFIACLLGDLSCAGCITSAHSTLSASPFFFSFFIFFIHLPLATRYVTVQGSVQLPRIPWGLIFFFWRTSLVPGVIIFCFVSCLGTCVFLFGLQPRRLWLNSADYLIYLGFFCFY